MIVLPNTPLSAPWLTKQESTLLQERLAESNVDLQTRRFDSKQFVGVFLDYKIYLFMLMFYSSMCPMYSIALLLPTIIRDLGFEPKTSMLLTAPPYLVAIICNILLAWNSDRTMNRGFHICGAALFATMGFVAMLVFETTLPRYLALCMIACGVCSISSPVLSWSNNTFIGSTRAATTAALVIMSASIGGIVASHLYLESEGPRYIQSNTINIINLLATIAISFILRFAFKYENMKLSQTNQSGDPHQFRYTL
ncbi:hypothetical protein DSO57_1020441 [Entomophthora muscae]|uniref:Uncharacterized protein n=1 Tax=Entomophthora muscae TaxID=34485 RepID=A0ACC2TR80_9FUNG|nr:hypothetical protein DSO57_1020441 [Entomophthora muscae]